MTKKHYLLKTGLLILAFVPVLFLYSCSDTSQNPELEQFVSNLRRAEALKKGKALAMPVATAVTYQADNLRSPFQGVEAHVRSKESLSNPLQAYPLTTLRFTGTVTQNDNTSIAYILTPDNMIYQVKVGDLIGDHDGKVKNIYADQLIIVEQDSENNKPAMRVITLRLKDTH